jgi:sugar phosphate isomerase/epimerase
MDAAGLIRRASGLGLRLVQIADNLPLERCNARELDEMRACARERNIALELGTRGIAKEHLRRLLELCRFFESRLLRVVVDTGQHEPSPDEVVQTIVDLLPELEHSGVRLAIENHDRFTAATFADIVKRVGHPSAGICLDTVNSFGSLEGPEIVIETLAPFVVNVHVKDFIVRRLPHMMGFEILGAPAGQGRLDIPKLLNRFPHSSAILELWPPFTGDIAETIETERFWGRTSVEFLRRLIAG